MFDYENSRIGFTHITTNYLGISPSLFDSACLEAPPTTISPESDGVSLTLILAVTLTSLALLALGIYLWWTRYIKNRRINLVMPKPIVHFRLFPSAFYQQIRMQASFNEAEEDISCYLFTRMETQEALITNENGNIGQTLLIDDEDDGKLMRSFIEQARCLGKGETQLTSKMSNYTVRNSVSSRVSQQFKSRGNFQWNIRDELEEEEIQCPSLPEYTNHLNLLSDQLDCSEL